MLAGFEAAGPFDSRPAIAREGVGVPTAGIATIDVGGIGRKGLGTPPVAGIERQVAIDAARQAEHSAGALRLEH